MVWESVIWTQFCIWLFSANFQFRAEVKKVTSRAELKILQLELWLEPAWLGLITTI